MIAAQPPATIAAPNKPPTSACIELVGMPSQAVTKFHTIAALSAAMISCGVAIDNVIKSRPMVVATLKPKTNGPTAAEAAAIKSARRGPIAREEIMVATILAESR